MKVNFLGRSRWNNRIINFFSILDNEIKNSKYLWQISRYLITISLILLYAKDIYGKNYEQLLVFDNAEKFAVILTAFFGYRIIKNKTNYFHLIIVLSIISLFAKFYYKIFYSLWLKLKVKKNLI